MRCTLMAVMVTILVLSHSFALGKTMVEMVSEAKEEFEKADAELNTVYGKLIDRLTKEQEEALRQAQRAWLEYRDASIVAEGAMYEGGSLQGLVQWRAAAELTIGRTERLKGMFVEGYPGGDRDQPAEDDERP